MPAKVRVTRIEMYMQTYEYQDYTVFAKKYQVLGRNSASDTWQKIHEEMDAMDSLFYDPIKCTRGLDSGTDCMHKQEITTDHSFSQIAVVFETKQPSEYLYVSLAELNIYGTSAETCTSCPPSTISPVGFTCEPCQIGFYSNGTRGATCEPCPYGTTNGTGTTSVNGCRCDLLGANLVLEPTQQQCVCDTGFEFVPNVTVFTPVVWKVDQDLTQKRSCDTICGDVGMECNFEIEGFESGFESFDAFMELVAGDTGLVFEAQDYKSFGNSETFRPSVRYSTSYKSLYVADKYKVDNIKTSSCDAAPSYNDEARICPCLRRYLQDQCLACPNGKFKNSLVEEKCSDCLFGTTNGTGAASALDLSLIHISEPTRPY